MDVYKRFFRRLQRLLEKETRDVPDTLSVSKYQIQYLLRENRYIYKVACKIKGGKATRIMILSEMLNRKLFEIMGKEHDFFRLRPHLRRRNQKNEKRGE